MSAEDDHIRQSLPQEMHEQLDHLLKMPDSPVRTELIDKLRCMADPVRAALPAEVRPHYDETMRMPPSPIRDDLVQRIRRMAGGEYNYFDWDGVAVRVSCADSSSHIYRDGAWQAGGPSYTVRLEECDELTSEQFAERFPDLA